jgi:hypothetical protein
VSNVKLVSCSQSPSIASGAQPEGEGVLPLPKPRSSVPKLSTLLLSLPLSLAVKSHIHLHLHNYNHNHPSNKSFRLTRPPNPALDSLCCPPDKSLDPSQSQSSHLRSASQTNQTNPRRAFSLGAAAPWARNTSSLASLFPASILLRHRSFACRNQSHHFASCCPHSTSCAPESIPAAVASRAWLNSNCDASMSSMHVSKKTSIGGGYPCPRRQKSTLFPGFEVSRLWTFAMSSYADALDAIVSSIIQKRNPKTSWFRRNGATYVFSTHSAPCEAHC